MTEYEEAGQDLLFGILDALPCGVILLNRTGESVFVNERGARLSPPLSDWDLTGHPLVLRSLAEDTPLTAPSGAFAPAGEASGESCSLYPVHGSSGIVGALLLCLPGEAESLLPRGAAVAPEPLSDARNAFARRRITDALAVYGHSVEGKRAAAHALGISLSTLYRLLSEPGQQAPR